MKTSYGIAFLTFLLCASCKQNAFEALPSTLVGGSGGSTCPTNVSTSTLSTKFQNAYQRNHTKVLFDGVQAEEAVLAKGTELSVLLRKDCFLAKTSVSPLLTSLVGKILPSKKIYSQENSFSIKLPFAATLSGLRELADREDCIVGISKEVYMETTSAAPNDPLYAQQVYMPSIRYDQIYETSFDSAEKLTGQYTTALIDDGFILTHPDLRNRLWTNPGEIPGNGIDDDGNGIIDDIHGANVSYIPAKGDPSTVNSYHGTHTSGFIGAELNNNEGVSGIMGANSRLMLINAWPAMLGYDNPNLSPMSAMDVGIRYAADMGAKVLNISMQGQALSANTEAALHYAVQKGVTIVVSAGNEAKDMGTNNYTGIPAYYSKDLPGLISVAATDSAGGSNGALCLFSSYSESYIEIAAPGCDMSLWRNYGGHGILSTLKGGMEPGSVYGYVQGTSMSSPIVAGIALYTYALLKEKAHLDPTPALVEEVIRNGSTTNSNLVGKIAGAKQADMKGIRDYVWNTYVNPLPSPTPVATPDPGNCH